MADTKPGVIFAKIGLALGGGGAKGIAHVGVLKAFEERRTSLACITGNSAGAIVAALYAFGRSSEEIEAFFEKITFSKISSILTQGLGLVGNQRLAELMLRELGPVDIKESLIPLAIVCTDLISGERKVFREGPLAILVQGSACVPGIFSPVSYNGMLLVDGALTENVPVSAARALGANFVVAVSLSDVKPHLYRPKGMMDVISRCFDIVVDSVSAHSLKEADYIISMDLSFINRFKVTQKNRAIDIAYQRTQKLFSRSLLYWWFRPLIEYFAEFARSVAELAATLLRKPTFKIPILENQIPPNDEMRKEHEKDHDDDGGGKGTRDNRL